MMNKLYFAVLLYFGATSAVFGGPQDVQRQGEPFVNIMQAANPGFENGLARWTASAGTFTKVTTAANVAVGATAASWDASAAAQTLTTSQQTIPAGLYGRSCRAAIYVKGGDANLTLRVIDGSSTTLAELAMPSANTNYERMALPFICPSSGTIAFRVVSTGNAALAYFDNLFVGETEAIETAAKEDWVNSSGWTTNDTGAAITAVEKRDGDTLHIRMRLGYAGASSLGSTSLLLFSPAGKSLDTTKVPGFVSDTAEVGYGVYYDDSVAKRYPLKMDYYHTGPAFSLRTHTNDAGIILTNDAISGINPATIAASDYILLNFSYPVQGQSSSVFITGANPEFAYNSDTSDADTLASGFEYGGQGVLFGNFTAARTKRVCFKTKIEARQTVFMQQLVPGASSGEDTWLDLGQYSYPVRFTGQAGTAYGVGLEPYDDNCVNVNFAEYVAPATGAYGAAGNPWSIVSTMKWRLVKANTPYVMGHGNVEQNKAGLVESAGQLKGTNTNDDADPGNVGEYVEDTYGPLTYSSSGVWVDAGQVTLTPGDWEITHQDVYDTQSSGVTSHRQLMGITATSGNSFPDFADGDNVLRASHVSTTTFSSLSVTVRKSISATTTFYAKVRAEDVSSPDPSFYGKIFARRIR